MNNKFTPETDSRKLFEHTGKTANADARKNIDQVNPHLRATFYKTPTINYFLYKSLPVSQILQLFHEAN